jgi:hypothetical protein
MWAPFFPTFKTPTVRVYDPSPWWKLWGLTRRDEPVNLEMAEYTRADLVPDPAALVRAALESAAAHVESIGHFGPKETGHTLATDFRAIATDPAAVAEIVAKAKGAGE